MTTRSRVARASARYDGDGLGRVGGDLDEVGADGLDVAAHDRAGEGGVALGERVVEGRVEQRAEGVGGAVATGGGQHLHRLGHQGDEVVGAVGEACVVERALVLRTHMVRPPRSATSCSVTARSASPAVTPKIALAQSGQVDLGAGEGHRRVQRDRARADGGGIGQDGQSVAPLVWDDVLALVDRAARTEHRDDVGQHVVGDGEEQQVGGPRSVAGLDHRGAGQEGLDAAAGGVGLTGGGHDLVARGAQRGGEDGADAACAHDTHTELSHVRTLSFQSRRPPLCGAGVGTRLGARSLALGAYAAANRRVNRK